MNDEQCPARSVGLTHIFDDGIRCKECGAIRAAPVFSQWYAEMIDSIRRSMRAPESPTKLIASGEKAPDPREPGDPDFAALTETQWHKLEVERRYWEHHGLDREDPCGR